MSGLQFQPLGDLAAELIALDGDPLHIDACRRQILMSERLLHSRAFEQSRISPIAAVAGVGHEMASEIALRSAFGVLPLLIRVGGLAPQRSL